MNFFKGLWHQQILSSFFDGKSKDEDITNVINKAQDTSQAKLTDIKPTQVKSEMKYQK